MRHIIGGNSAASALKKALNLKSDQLIVNEDLLSCGPAPGTEDLRDWRRLREAFLQDVFGTSDAVFGAGPYNSLIDLLGDIIESNEPATLWVGAGLSDQLLLAWVLAMAEALNGRHDHLRLIEINDIGAGAPVFGMGELPIAYFMHFADAAMSISKTQATEYRAAWRAYSSASPDGLAAFLARDIASANLKNAMRVLVARYPSRTSGLSHPDERLLELAEEKGPRVASVIGHMMSQENRGDRAGDLYLFWRLKRLADENLNAPLLFIEGVTQRLRSCQTMLSPFGERVLNGAENAIDKNGIDDWVGGVHLSGDQPLAVRDGDELKILG